MLHDMHVFWKFATYFLELTGVNFEAAASAFETSMYLCISSINEE